MFNKEHKDNKELKAGVNKELNNKELNVEGNNEHNKELKVGANKEHNNKELKAGVNKDNNLLNQ